MSRARFVRQSLIQPDHKANNSQQVFDRYVSIWLENTDFDNAAGDSNLVWLASKGISVSNMFGVTHPSMPNYIAAVGGDTFGCDNDDFKRIDANVSTLVDLLEDKGISWSTYQEDMPYSGFEGKGYVNQKTKANDYVRKHHPTVIFDANTTPERLANQKNISMTNKDASMFHKDLAEGKLPQWMFITPNMVRGSRYNSSKTQADISIDKRRPRHLRLSRRKMVPRLPRALDQRQILQLLEPYARTHHVR
jgi:hypothetical protein